MTDFRKWMVEQETQQVLYHVTMIRKLPRIRTAGLTPNQPSAFTAGFYPKYSRGKVFLTDAKGVGFWKHKIEYAEFDQFDDPMGVAVLTVNVAGLDPQKDEEGSRDSGSEAFFVKQAIPASRIVHVEEFPEE